MNDLLSSAQLEVDSCTHPPTLTSTDDARVVIHPREAQILSSFQFWFRGSETTYPVFAAQQ